MGTAPRTILTLRLADAHRVERHGLLVLQGISANRALPFHVRDRSELHHVETEAQLKRIDEALELLSPTLAARLATAAWDAPVRTPGLADWTRLEAREIDAYAALMPYVRHADVPALATDCAAALDLQRSVLHWLESLADPALSRAGPAFEPPHSAMT